MDIKKLIFGYGSILYGAYLTVKSIIGIFKVDDLYDSIFNLGGLKTKATFGVLLFMFGFVYLLLWDDFAEYFKSKESNLEDKEEKEVEEQ